MTDPFDSPAGPDTPDRRSYDAFDAALREELGEPVTFTLLGQEWTLKSEQPAILMLTMLRAQTEGRDFLRSSEEHKLLDALLHEGATDRLLQLGIGPTGIDMLISVSIAIYGGASVETAVARWREGRKAHRDRIAALAAGEAPPQGEAQGPDAAPTSSPTSTSSSTTSTPGTG